MNSHQKATVLLSGGIDSAACAHFLLSQGLNVDALFIDYSQAACEQEQTASIMIAEKLKIPLRSIRVDGLRKHGSGELQGRNAMLICNALFVTRGKSNLLATGIHAGTPYFDCSEKFLSDMGRIVAECTDGKVNLINPFMQWSKQEVGQYYLQSGLSFSESYSCELGTLPVCGKCASCLDRRALECLQKDAR